MLKSSATALVALLVLAPLAPVAAALAQDDAGSGGDAGNAWPDATDVTRTPEFQGILDAGAADAADWYYLDVPAFTGVRVWLFSEYGSDYDLLVASNEGEVLGTSTAWGTAPDTVAVATRTAGLRFQVSGAGDQPYTVRVETFDLPALRITDLHVLPDYALGKTGGTLPQAQPFADPNLHREVYFTVENTGTGWAHDMVYAIVVASSGSYRLLAQDFMPVGPGASRTFMAKWDATGQVGDVEVIAAVTTAAELDVSDNVASLKSPVLVGGIPGDDLLNNGVEEDNEYVYVGLGSTYATEYAGLWSAFYTALTAVIVEQTYSHDRTSYFGNACAFTLVGGDCAFVSARKQDPRDGTGASASGGAMPGQARVDGGLDPKGNPTLLVCSRSGGPWWQCDQVLG